MKKVLLALLCVAALTSTASAQYRGSFGGYRTRFATPFVGTSSFYGSAGLVGGCGYATSCYQPVVATPVIAQVVAPVPVLAAPACTSCGCGAQAALLPATVGYGGYGGIYGSIGTAFYGSGYRAGFFAFRGGRGRR